MRYRLIVCLTVLAASLHGGVTWGSFDLFKTFFEQRELVASIYFEQGSSRLTDQAEKELESALPRIMGPACDARLIRVEGYSGKEGSAESNFRLSMNRANSVAMFLERRGVPCLVGVNGYGDLRLAADPAVNNLRVEIAAYPKLIIFDNEDADVTDFGEDIKHGYARRF